MAGHPVTPIRILLADDHAMVREGMAEMLTATEGIEVVGQAENGREALALIRELEPDVVILDVEMPIMGAQAVLRRLCEIPSPPKVVIATVFANNSLMRELVNLGASAYLVKNASMEDLITTVRSVAGSQRKEEQVILAMPRDAMEAADDNSESPLSRRETEILLWAARGMSNRQIGEASHLSETTVKRHLSNVYAKLEVGSRTEAIHKAISEDWISVWDVSRAD